VYNKKDWEILSKNKNKEMKMKQTLYYGNITHSISQQTKKTQGVFIQKQFRLAKKWLRQIRAFIKKSFEENGDFFLNGGDF
jgi:hypothetical protein